MNYYLEISRNGLISRIQYLLLLLIILFSVWPELRISTHGFKIAFNNQAGFVGGAQGYPRAIEILAILLIVFSFLQMLNLGKVPSSRIFHYNLAILLIVAFCVIRFYHGSQFARLRSGFVIPILLFLSIAFIELNDRKLEKILATFLITFLISGMIIILQAAGLLNLPKVPLYSYLYITGCRYAGLGQSYAYQSAYLLFGSVISFSLISAGSFNGWLKLLAYINIFVSMVGIILAGARTGYICFFVLLLIFLYNEWHKRNFGGQIILLLIILFVAIFSVVFSIDSGVLFNETKNTLISRLLLQSNKLLDWSMGMQVLLRSGPFIGVDNYEIAATNLNIWTTAHAQNAFIGTFIFGGILVGTGYFIWLGKIFHSVSINFHEPIRNCGLLKRILGGLFLVYLLFSMTEIITFSSQVQVPFFLLVGIIVSYLYQQKRKKLSSACE